MTTIEVRGDGRTQVLCCRLTRTMAICLEPDEWGIVHRFQLVYGHGTGKSRHLQIQFNGPGTTDDVRQTREAWLIELKRRQDVKQAEMELQSRRCKRDRKKNIEEWERTGEWRHVERVEHEGLVAVIGVPPPSQLRGNQRSFIRLDWDCPIGELIFASYYMPRSSRDLTMGILVAMKWLIDNEVSADDIRSMRNHFGSGLDLVVDEPDRLVRAGSPDLKLVD